MKFEKVEDNEYTCVGGPKDGDPCTIQPGDRERKAFWADAMTAHFYRIDRKGKRLVFLGTQKYTDPPP